MGSLSGCIYGRARCYLRLGMGLRSEVSHCVALRLDRHGSPPPFCRDPGYAVIFLLGSPQGCNAPHQREYSTSPRSTVTPVCTSPRDTMATALCSTSGYAPGTREQLLNGICKPGPFGGTESQTALCIVHLIVRTAFGSSLGVSFTAVYPAKYLILTGFSFFVCKTRLAIPTLW